ncbi:MAG: ArsA-related P-loop ATPase [Nannocystaceae bacterium]|nr:chromosome partitioning protein [bacterium]
MAGQQPALEKRSVPAIFDDLSRRRLVVVSGKGGVGRTTLAALLGVALSARGKRVLVATTGHDDRLAWMLGAEALSDARQQVGDSLWVQRLVPQTCIREYGGMVIHSQRVSSAVFDNTVVRRLMRAIPGLDDFSLLGKAWHEAVRGGDFDCVIFDGPATGHLIYTLGVPQAILETVPSGPLTSEARLMQAALEDPEVTQAVLVGLPEAWPLTELGELGATLRAKLRMHVAAIVVNGLWPSDVPVVPEPSSDAQGLAAAFAEQVNRIGDIGRAQAGDVDAWSRSQAALGCGAGAWTTLPWRWRGVSDRASVRAFLQVLGDRGDQLA